MYVLWIMLGFLFLYIWRIIIGPSIWDRLMIMNIMSTKIIVIIIFFAFTNDSAYLLDFAVIYALFGFIGTIFIALFLFERNKKERK